MEMDLDIKHNPIEIMERLKARLGANGYAQTYGLFETSFVVAKLNSIRVSANKE